MSETGGMTRFSGQGVVTGNELAPVSTRGNSVVAYETEGELGALIRGYQRGVPMPALSGAILQEARSRLAELEAACRQASASDSGPWLATLSKMNLRGIPTDEKALGTASAALIATCAEFPVGAWTRETRIAYAQTHKFWPDPNTLYEHMKPYALSLYRERSSLSGLIASASAPKTEPAADRPKSQEEIERILAEFRPRYAAAVAEARRQAAEDDARLKPSPPKPAYLTPEQLRIARHAAAMERLRGG